MTMERKKKSIWQILLDVIELYIPALMFLTLFSSFIIGIFFRYIMKDPQSWTYELGSITFLSTVLLAGCIADRNGEHVVFDMIYNAKSLKIQCVMRIISNLMIVVFLSIIFPASIRYLVSFKKVVTPIMKIPQYLVFISFPILFIDLIIRAACRLYADIRAFINKSYIQYNKEKEDVVE